MKFYRLRKGKKIKGFLSATREDIIRQVQFRNRDLTEEEVKSELEREVFKYWWYDEVEIEEEDVGICWNNFPHIGTPSAIVTAHSPLCGVGSVRIDRSGKRKRADDVKFKEGTCSECPYFISGIQLDEVAEKLLEGYDE